MSDFKVGDRVHIADTNEGVVKSFNATGTRFELEGNPGYWYQTEENHAAGRCNPANWTRAITVLERAPEWQEDDLVIYTGITGRAYPLWRKAAGHWNSPGVKADFTDDAHLEQAIANGMVEVIVKGGRRVSA